LHPEAHLWDNGNDPVKELKNVMNIRSKALSKFGLNNIPQGTPMAMLEDVLVPVYLFHRYQVEAVSKQVGGMYYSYAIKGDGQMVTRSVSKEVQLEALKALVDYSDRLGIDTEVYTFLGQDAVDAIDRWLGRKGISLPVYSYNSVEELSYDLRFKRSVRTIYVPEQEQAAIIGLRATVADSKKAWSI
jgi:hypothetical protein